MPAVLLLLNWDMFSASATSAAAAASKAEPVAVAMMEWLLAGCDVDVE